MGVYGGSIEVQMSDNGSQLGLDSINRGDGEENELVGAGRGWERVYTRSGTISVSWHPAEEFLTFNLLLEFASRSIYRICGSREELRVSNLRKGSTRRKSGRANL